MSQPNWVNQTIWTGDNLDIMRGMNSESVDLIYLDPPFNSNADYSAPIGSEAAGAEFKDTWGLDDVNIAWHGLIKSEHPGLFKMLDTVREIHGDSMMSYLIYMAARLMEMLRLLKDTGSIYLHCDPTASHYLKLIMDSIFGRAMFVNEIVWERIKGAGKASQHKSRSFGSSSDCLLLYAVTSSYSFNIEATGIPLSDEEIARKFKLSDAKGPYYRRSPFRPPGLGDRPNLCYEFKGFFPPHPSGWVGSRDYMEQLDADGDIEIAGGKIYRKQRPKDILPQNIWCDIPQVSSAEDVGYPTQKPLALLERIIRASSNSGDTVLDPFCGCATACIAAERLGREWIGIDISEKAAELVAMRMEKDLGLFWNGTHRSDIPTRTDLGKIPAYSTTENKKRLYGEQAGHCNACETHFQIQNLTIDHIIPRSGGGTDHISNLQLLCGSCNSTKGNRPQEWLMARLLEKDYIKRRLQFDAKRPNTSNT